MKILNKMIKVATPLLISLILLIPSFVTTPSKVFASHSRVSLGSADNFAVLAGTAITNVPTSTITGDLGLSPEAGSNYSGITTAQVSGTIYAVDATGPTGSVNNPGVLTSAKSDLVTAYNDAAGRTTTSTIGSGLGGTTLTDGTYDSAAGTFSIASGTTLTLNGEGNANAVFIFKMASSLTTVSNSTIVLTNGAQACNVFWQVGSSATLGTNTTFKGTIMALTSITVATGANIAGRTLARNGAVTLDSNTISKSTCAAGTSGGPAATSSSSSSSTGSSTAVCPTLNYITPSIIESRRVDEDSVFLSWGPYSGINTFTVRYGLTDGNWTYSTKVTGFSTTLNDLPANQPIWVQVAATDNCSIGSYSTSLLIGGSSRTSSPLLPNTGIGPRERSVLLPLLFGLFLSASFVYIARKRVGFPSKRR